jgi:hypothetical protein
MMFRSRNGMRQELTEESEKLMQYLMQLQAEPAGSVELRSSDPKTTEAMKQKRFTCCHSGTSSLQGR